MDIVYGHICLTQRLSELRDFGGTSTPLTREVALYMRPGPASSSATDLNAAARTGIGLLVVGVIIRRALLTDQPTLTPFFGHRQSRELDTLVVAAAHSFLDRIERDGEEFLALVYKVDSSGCQRSMQFPLELRRVLGMNSGLLRQV